MGIVNEGFKRGELTVISSGTGKQMFERAEFNEHHTCPYLEEMGGDTDTLCDCDEAATEQCALSI